MLNGKQREKAHEKILEQEGVDPVKHRAMLNHIKARYYSKRLLLPYRVCLDYIKRPKAPGEVELNDCYPLPGYPKDKVIAVHYPRDFEKQEDYIYSVNGIYNLDNLTESAKEIVEKNNKPYKGTGLIGDILLDTEGAYIKLLEGYNLDTFSVFDWFGCGEGADELKGTDGQVITGIECGIFANVLNYELEQYQRNKAEHPEQYKKHKYTTKQLERYQEQPFNIIWDTELISNED